MLHDGRSGKKKVAIQSAQSIGWATSDDRCVKAGVYEVVRSCESQRRGSLSLKPFCRRLRKETLFILMSLASDIHYVAMWHAHAVIAPYYG